MSSTEDIIGRADVNDVDAILAVSNTDVDAVEHVVADNADALFTWDYTLARPALRKLYEKAKTGQWNAPADLPWDTEVDQEAIVIANNDQAVARGLTMDDDYFIGSPVEHWGDKEWLQFNMEKQNWTLSQFLHGEQGALLCTAKIVETVPWYDAKLYASTQVMDEARHVEVFARYLDEKLTGHYPINAHLRLLLDDIVNDSRWDMTYLGMQIMVEGLALAAFGFMHQMTTEPLLKQLLRYVMSDEARHVAFGVLRLKEVYAGMTAAELRERQEFAYEAAVRMRDRFLSQEVWDRLGISTKEIVPYLLADPTREPLPADAVLQDRAQLQEARPARRGRRLAAPAVHRDRRDPVRGLGRHGRGVRQLRARPRGARPGRVADPPASSGRRCALCRRLA